MNKERNEASLILKIILSMLQLRQFYFALIYLLFNKDYYCLITSLQK